MNVNVTSNLEFVRMLSNLLDCSAISVRISNELGAGRPRAAKFSILVVVMTSALLGLAFFILVLSLKDVYGLPFTNSPDVVEAVSSLAVLFAFTLLLNSVQPVLTGQTYIC